MKRIYLDYAATSPLAPEAKEVIRDFLNHPELANPSSLHAEGRAAQAWLDKAHTTIGAILGVHPTEVVFTSGATESNFLAIRGTVQAWKTQHPNQTPHIVFSSLEHPSWRNAAQSLDAEVTIVPVSPHGVAESDNFMNALQNNTALVGCLYVSNELGTIQPVTALGKAVEAYRIQHKTQWPVFHVDAVQAFPFLNTHSGHVHADSMTFSGHKYGALSGTGILTVKKNTPLTSVIKGGSQEWGYRAGTENVLGAATAAAVMEWLDSHRDHVTTHVQTLQKTLEEKLKIALPGVTILGQNTSRAPHITYLWLPGVTDEHLIHKLDLAGVAASSGSACSSGAMLPSATLLALGFSEQESFGGLRMSYGRFITQEEIEQAIKILIMVLA